MSFNGSGTFLINSSGQPVVTGTTISSTVFNALTADLATGLTNAICKDGQSTTTGTIPFATAVTMASTLAVTGATTLSSTLAVTGATTLSSTLAVTGATTLSSALTYGGVTLSNSVTGTGSMMLSASPTTTGTLTAAAINSTGAIANTLSTDAAFGPTVTNSNAGTSAQARFVATNGTATVVTGVFGTGFTTSGQFVAGRGLLLNTGASFVYSVASGSHIFSCDAGVTAHATLTSSGLTLPGTLGVTGVTSLATAGGGGSIAVNGSFASTAKITFSDGGGSSDTQIRTYRPVGDGVNSYANAIVNSSGDMLFQTASATAAPVSETLNTRLKISFAGAVTIPGTLGVTGAITASNLTASRAVLTDGSKNLISADAPVTNSLGADVTLNNIANYFDGPSCANGTTGTFFVSGTVTLTATAATSVYLKLWDGATVIASCSVAVGTGSSTTCATLSGYLTTPAGNLRISARDPSRTDTKIVFNTTGNSKDSTISAVRVA